MKDIDARIKEALEADEERFLDGQDHELPLLEQVRRSFRGRSRWLMVMVMVAMTGLMVFGGFALVRFFAAEDVREILSWSLAVTFVILGVMAMKIWYWMELSRLNVTREVKRVEIQMAQVVALLKELQEKG